ncbi:hypothetical protein ACNTMW_00705 [Planosporangium sp. 12N6]|uniref:hypothetical protein n=1 Tax=Planosporangium spinosum TaxID=3402278 RepID=UPI003CFA8EA8
MSTKNGAKAKSEQLTGEPRDNAADTRETLDGTVTAIADKAGATTRTRDTVQHVSTEAHEGGRQVGGTVRNHPARWASVGAGAVAATAATVGALKWRQARRAPRSRAERIWRGMTKRFGR